MPIGSFARKMNFLILIIRYEAYINLLEYIM